MEENGTYACTDFEADRYFSDYRFESECRAGQHEILPRPSLAQTRMPGRGAAVIKESKKAKKGIKHFFEKAIC